MKSIGIVRKIDRLGRIVIPIEMRRALSLDESMSVEIMADGERIILQRQQSNCMFCGSRNIVASLYGHSICQECLGKLNASSAYEDNGDVCSDDALDK